MASVTVILIVVCVLCSLWAWKNQDILRKWIFNPYLVRTKNQYYRFLTSGFIHADYGHLFFNMFTLFFFGSVLETYFQYFFGEKGKIIYVAFFLAGIIISDIPTYLRHRKNPGYNGLGASGGVSSVVFSAIVLNPLADVCLYGLLCLPGVVMGALYLGYSIWQDKRGGDNINHSAHLYGAVFGIVFTLLAIPNSLPNFIEQVKNLKF